MTGDDLRYLQSLLARGYIQSPCLELGVGLEGTGNKELLERQGIQYYGTDITPGPMVDFLIDFEASPESIRDKISCPGEIGTILVFNVLEHVFDPIKVLDNVFSVLRPTGTCAVITPAVWPLHSFPIDCWRILPDFYVEYARRRNLTLLQDTFRYVQCGPIANYRAPVGTRVFPNPAKSSLYFWYSKGIHKLFNTFGREMSAPANLGIGVVIKNASSDSTC
jgi:SAM-dependent methyltransferase